MANAKLGTKAVGSIVKLKVNGAAKEFIVVHQGKPSSIYDESCNGTWLLMKDCYEKRQWNSWDSNVYETSTINTYLNGTFFGLFDANIQEIIKQVKIPYRNGGGNGSDKSGSDGLSCKVFLLSAPEVGLSSQSYVPNDGNKLDYFIDGMTSDAIARRNAYLGDVYVTWYLRSPWTMQTAYVWEVNTTGAGGPNASYSSGIRPCIILPSTTLVDDSGNVVTVDLTAHKTLVNGTAYEVKGGKCMVGGTVYNILKGRTLIGGTGYDITFGPPPMPVKGDLITMNLDGTARLYRVLSVNGNVCKILGMWDDFTSKYNETSMTTNFNGTTSQKYKGSTLDTYLNITWYNTLSSEAKNAIVSENVVQYCYKYYDAPNTPNTPTYTYQYQYNWSNSDYENADNVGNVVVGNRNVFALDLKDIFDYIGKVCITSDELMTMFWNSTTVVSKYLWLRSSAANTSSRAWRVDGRKGRLDYVGASAIIVVRPVLNLDMSKIQYTIV